MDSRDEPTTPTTPTTPVVDDDFELVTKKRKGKRKKALRSGSLTEPLSYDSRSKVTTLSSKRKQESSGNSSERDKGLVVDFVWEAMDKIRLDAQVSNLPQGFEDKAVYQGGKEEEVRRKSESEVTISGDHQRGVEKINTKALSQHASTYELERFEKNALLIFNHVNVDGYDLPRLGTEKDVEILERTFRKFGFEVKIEQDLTKDEIMSSLRTFTSQDFTDYGCVAVAVLSHGSRDGRIKAKDMPYSELEIVNQLQVLNKPTLLTKPRLLIVQACRGTKDIRGVTVGQAYGIRKDLDEEVEAYTLPVEADMLVLHSSYIGKPSHRHELYGSWFIQSLCSKIDQLSSTLDLEAILTEVKREVAIDKWHNERNRRTNELDTNKQMPVSTSTLTRKLYLRRYQEASPAVTESSSDGVAHGNNLSVLDSSIPNTPLPILQYGPCFCFLDHFAYIRDCLGHYLVENPEDSTALSYLSLADTLDDDEKFHGTKEQTAKLICQHLRSKGKGSAYFKYLYFYKH